MEELKHRVPIRCMGTTHADHFRGDVPVTRALTRKEVAREYEKETGRVIVETFRKMRLSPEEVSAVLVRNHGPFAWGEDISQAVHNATVLEIIARLNSETLHINPKAKPVQSALLRKHFLRKHGPDAYYGQR